MFLGLSQTAWYLILLIVISCAGVVLIAGQTVVPARAKAYLVITATSGAILLAELASMICIDTTDMFWLTLQTKRWYERHWIVNSEGYRDREWEPDLHHANHKVIVVGDSLVAGTGINDPNQRFANILGSRLGPDWRVFVLARLGWGPVQERKAIEKFPERTDLAILSYYTNDFSDALAECGREPSFKTTANPKFGNWFVENSFLFSFLYWRYVRADPLSVGRNYAESVKRAAEDSVCLEVHGRQLKSLVSTARGKAQRVVAVIFPDLIDTEWSTEITAYAQKIFEGEDVQTWNVSEIVANRPREELIVSPMDAHPSMKLHREVGEGLFKLLNPVSPGDHKIARVSEW